MHSATKHRREGAFDMSSEGQPDSRVDGSDAGHADSKFFATLDQRQLEQNAESQDLAMQGAALGSGGAGLKHDEPHTLGAKTNGDDVQESLLSRQKGKNQEEDVSEPASLATTQPVLLNHTVRSAGSASTPNLKTTLNPSNFPQTARPGANESRYDATSKLSTFRNPPPLPTKPRGDIRDRSSSYGAPSSFQGTASGSTFTNPEASRNKGQAGTYGSVKSNKEDGFKSMRIRAKGMLSRMFSTSRQNAPSVPTVPAREIFEKSPPALTRRTTSKADLPVAASAPNQSATPKAELSRAESSNNPQPTRSSNAAEVAKKLEGRPQLSPPSSTVETRPTPTKRLRSAPTSIPGRGSSISPAVSPAGVQEENPLEATAGLSRPDEAVRANTVSRHVREGALSQIDSGVEASDKEVQSPSQALSGRDVSPDSFKDWKQNMEGMLDGERIEEDLHRELGVSAASIGALAGADHAADHAAASPERKPRPLIAGGEQPVDLDKDGGLVESSGLPTQSGVDNDHNGDRSTAPVESEPQTSHSPVPPLETMKISDSQDGPRRSSPHQDGLPGSNAVSSPTEPKDDAAQLPLPTAEPKSFPKEADDPELYGKMLATEIYHEDEAHIHKEDVAEYLGGVKPSAKFALSHYMASFDFSNLRVDEAFRLLCAKLYLKAETQEVDRILEAFSQRYFACNPDTIFGSSDVIHTVTGSFLLLNTDLHIADITTHMSRSQFIRLTLQTIDSHLGTFSPMSSTPELVPGATTRRPSLGAMVKADTRTRSAEDKVAQATSGPLTSESENDQAGLSIRDSPALELPVEAAKTRVTSSASMGSFRSIRGREHELEGILREIYTAVKNNQILLPVAAPDMYSPLRRGDSRQSSKRRASFRGISSVFHPANEEHRLQAISENATPAIGFVSNLANAIIKERDEDKASIKTSRTTGSQDELTDDQLALMGPPWAKEGNLFKKLYLNAEGKRSRDKNWKQVFAVLQKGEIHMFVFGEGADLKDRNAVGGGNWMANARGTGDFNLSHTVASPLPPPGYNAARPYCFRLKFSSGETNIFQAGTEDLTHEWVSTCNYWAARRTRPPLPGGVTNAEYGWRSLESRQEDRDDTVSVFSNRSSKSKISFQNTLGRRNNSLVSISEWEAPQPTLTPSTLEEELQLESLQRHLEHLAKDIKLHELYEEPLNRLYPPRSSSLIRAKDNWNNKFTYLKSEMDKYKLYVTCLRRAIALRVQAQGEKQLHRSLQFGSGYESHDDDDYHEYNDTDDDGLPYDEG